MVLSLADGPPCFQVHGLAPCASHSAWCGVCAPPPFDPLECTPSPVALAAGACRAPCGLPLGSSTCTGLLEPLSRDPLGAAWTPGTLNGPRKGNIIPSCRNESAEEIIIFVSDRRQRDRDEEEKTR